MDDSVIYDYENMPEEEFLDKYKDKELLEALHQREDRALVDNLDIHPLTLARLMEEQFTNDLWLVENLIPLNGITVLSAQPGSFKTWLLLSIALSVASGSKLFGEFETKDAGVLMVDEENGLRLLQQRLQKLNANPNWPIYFLSDTNFKLKERPIADLIDYCLAYDIRLITFDSLVRVHGANENDAMEMAQVFSSLKEFARAEITVILSHHNRKPGNSSVNGQSHEMRGSSDILAALDSHLALVRENKNNLVLTQTKVRLSEELPPLELKVISSDDGLTIEYVGSRKPSESKRELVKAKIFDVLTTHEQFNQRQIHQQLKDSDIMVNRRTLSSILEKMIADNEIQKSPGERNSKIYRLNSETNNTNE